MAIEHGKTRAWTRSSHSAGQGACVEVRSPAGGLLSVRDSKAPAGPRLRFPSGAWSAFVAGMPPSGQRGR
ncbi:protein of unknown function [Streptomyces zhaozhouensis]|uniref:DUF397 domain-containing protein n=1 Tax=Streptomyces zhaozhouensis TaxID=1300267 RepID=A0A286DY06_9ACTN|nr:DUF397 domain-containing protein [Streptomyces zhaozhouensis]SOD63510.1 protein of unknown function [Streptomyces zhaozhouensis]